MENKEKIKEKFKEKGRGGIQLLEKGHKGFIHVLFSRTGLIALLFLLQVVLIFGIYRWFAAFIPQIVGLGVVFEIIMIIHLLNSESNNVSKITWLVLIMLAPVMGTLLYWYTLMDIGHRAEKRRIDKLVNQTRGMIPQNDQIMERIEREKESLLGLSHYLNRMGCFPVYDKTEVMYFPTGEDKFQEMLIRLEQAEKFIFLEYFIIDEGLMWGRVLEILARKAKQGVDVRLLYDGTCEFSTLPHDYPKRLQILGIQCKMFAPLTPLVSTRYNYRDHRKILVIDGKVAFNGGINLADEYINYIERFGHWKDTAVMLRGEAVRSFTLMFLQMWNFDEKNMEFEQYVNATIKPFEEEKGYVIPYGSSPLDKEKVGEMVYIEILYHAKKYVHIMTPYLILDGELEMALKYAAERGVEVELILPGIPDKKAPYILAKTHYESLMKAGVKIYEYLPGFVHAKVVVSDDETAVVGTINLDYRSLYHHFECATLMFKTKCIEKIEEDFISTRKKCRLVTEEVLTKEKWKILIFGYVIKVLAPLL